MLGAKTLTSHKRYVKSELNIHHFLFPVLLPVTGASEFCKLIGCETGIRFSTPIWCFALSDLPSPSTTAKPSIVVVGLFWSFAMKISPYEAKHRALYHARSVHFFRGRVGLVEIRPVGLFAELEFELTDDAIRRLLTVAI
jgi:hypothetical protein